MSFYIFADCTEPFIVDIFTDGVADDAKGVAGGKNTIQSRGKSCLFLLNFYNADEISPISSRSLSGLHPDTLQFDMNALNRRERWILQHASLCRQRNCKVLFFKEFSAAVANNVMSKCVLNETKTKQLASHRFISVIRRFMFRNFDVTTYFSLTCARAGPGSIVRLKTGCFEKWLRFCTVFADDCLN